MQSITLVRPDDWHLHVRDDAALEAVVPHTAARFGRALIMPNLKPPVTSTAQALAYRERILAAAPGARFEPLMSLYLTDNLDPDEIDRARATGRIVACKLYPAGATTNSDAGVTAIDKIYPVLERMEKLGMVLCVHGEATGADVDVFDRERVFIERTLSPLVRRFPVSRSCSSTSRRPRRPSSCVRRAPTLRPRLPFTICCSIAMRSSPAAFARITTACRYSSARRTARRWLPR